MKHELTVKDMAAMFDTLKWFKKFVDVGFTEAQAKALVYIYLDIYIQINGTDSQKEEARKRWASGDL